MKFDANSIKRYLSGVISDLDEGRKPERSRTWLRALVVPAALGVSIGATSCLETEPSSAITKDEVIEAKANGDDAELCEELQALADCDLCDEMGWYNDGACDEFCDQADPDCTTLLYGFPMPDPENQYDNGCGDGIDNDGNGFVDCCDEACADDELCGPIPTMRYMAQLTETECGDCRDNDSDGLIDADDPDCGAVAEYAAPFEEVCGDGIDNDDNGLTDCCDEACAEDELCGPIACARYMAQLTEIECGDCLDNDCDGLIDDEDGDCVAGDE